MINSDKNPRFAAVAFALYDVAYKTADILLDHFGGTAVTATVNKDGWLDHLTIVGQQTPRSVHNLIDDAPTDVKQAMWDFETALVLLATVRGQLGETSPAKFKLHHR